MEYTGPSAADYESIGWPKTDAFVSDSREILSTTKVYEAGLFSEGPNYCTVLVAVSSLPYKDKDTGLPEEAGYGIYWTPQVSTKPFRAYHCSKTTRWLAEHGSEALPRYVRMEKTKIKGKDAFNPTFFPMDEKTADFLWNHVIPGAWQTIIKNEAKEFP
jgi:hypothetical protein